MMWFTSILAVVLVACVLHSASSIPYSCSSSSQTDEAKCNRACNSLRTFEELCPFKSVCYNDLNDTGIGCCEQCPHLCSPGCREKNTCCTRRTNDLKHYETCTQFRMSKNNTYSFIAAFLMVTSCPNTSSDVLKQNCSMEEILWKVNYLNDFAPVYHPILDMNFRNKYCVDCHGYRLSETVPWVFHRSNHVCYLDRTKMTYGALHFESTANCHVLLYSPPPWIDLRASFCKPTCTVIPNETNICNRSIHYCVKDRHALIHTYDAYSCAADEECSSICCNCVGGPDTFYSPFQMFPMTALLDFWNTDRPSSGYVGSDLTCPSGYFVDVLTKKCRRVFCPSEDNGRAIEMSDDCVDGEEDPWNNSTTYFRTHYKTVIYLIPDRGNTIPSSCIDNLYDDIIQRSISIADCKELFFLGLQGYTDPADTITTALAVHIYFKHVDSTTEPLLSTIESVFYKFLSERNLEITCSWAANEVYTFSFQFITRFMAVQKASRSFFKSYVRSTKYGKWNDLYQVMRKRPLNKTKTVSLYSICPQVMFSLDEVTATPNGFVIKTPTASVTLAYRDINVISGVFGVYICKKYYMKIISSMPLKMPHLTLSLEDSVLRIVSFTCMSLSVVSLISSLCVYALLPELCKNQPGKNTLILSISLLIAQVFFLFGINSFENAIVCQLLGGMIHFFWLVAISSMTFSTVYLFSVFVVNPYRSMGSENLNSVHHIVFAMAIPLPFVAVNIITAQYFSDSKNWGYGPDICFINSKPMLGYTFALPVAILIFSNIVLVLSVIFKIEKALHQSQHYLGQEGRNSAVMYCKLFIFTGGLFVIGYINEFVGHPVLEYAFVILNASQGVFLMATLISRKGNRIRLIGHFQR